MAKKKSKAVKKVDKADKYLSASAKAELLKLKAMK